MRAGNAHVYNVVKDSVDAYAAKGKITSSMETALAGKGYKLGITSNGSISTEGGAVLVEKCNIIEIIYVTLSLGPKFLGNIYNCKLLVYNTNY